MIDPVTMHRAPFLILLLLVGCVAPPPPPAPRPSGARPPAPGMPTSAETRACLADLDRAAVRYFPVADTNYGGGCSLVGAVQVSDVGVPVTGLKGMRCSLARSFSAWVRYAIAPAAHQILGSELVRVETFGSYACRNTIGTAPSYTRRSGHAIGNAVDVSGFVLADGRRITILGDWRGGDADTREFLRVIHASACKRFGTVLSPDYNAAHANHLHLEDDHAAYCR